MKKKQKPDLTLKEIISTMIKIIIFPSTPYFSLVSHQDWLSVHPYRFYIFAEHDGHTIFSLFFVKQNS